MNSHFVINIASPTIHGPIVLTMCLFPGICMMLGVGILSLDAALRG